MRFILALLMLLAGLARADPGEPMAWLGRIAMAPQRLGYTGVFVYQNGAHSETSRIVHGLGLAGERERIESLDGSPREVIRGEGRVTCYLPRQRLVLIETETSAKSFPASLPASLGKLPLNYLVTLGEAVRIAGHESQLIILKPKDRFRYGHLLWADRESGLLLKSAMLDENGAVLEQGSFTEIRIGQPVEPSALGSRWADKAGDWQKHVAREAADGAGEWIFRTAIPGFRKTASVRRHGGQAAGEALHLVFSDGMASLSVFIEPARTEKVGPGLSGSGATHIYQRIVGDSLVTVLGEVPFRTLRDFGDGIDRQRR